MFRAASFVALGATLAGLVSGSCPSSDGPYQMVTYVKSRDDWSVSEFWEYWQTEHAPRVAPLAAYHNVSQYQQVQVSGKILPTEAGATRPSSDELVDFHGIALFVYDRPEDLEAMLSHQYYIDVVEPDEGVFIDKEAPGGGMVVTYIGRNVEVVNNPRGVWPGDEENRVKFQELFDSYV